MTMTVTETPPRPPLARLTVVELRKMTDTRSGRWLLGIMGLSLFALIPVILFAVEPQEQTLTEFTSVTHVGPSLLLPVLGILSVTSEWSQRTALTTFALVPDRSRVLAAKLLAGSALATAFMVLGLAVGVAGRGLGGLMGRSAGSWELPMSYIGVGVVAAVALVAMGVAFGLALMSPALAIVVYFVLPTVWTTLGESVDRLRTWAEWLDTNRTMAALSESGATTGEWGRLGTSLAVWLLVPMVIGLVRLARREVS